MLLPPGCSGLRVRRMTVLWTFRRPFMGRPMLRPFMRNALLDLATIVPATAYHRRSYAERYSRFIYAVGKGNHCTRKMYPTLEGNLALTPTLLTCYPCARERLR
jgi:hypothetical protein